MILQLKWFLLGCSLFWRLVRTTNSFKLVDMMVPVVLGSVDCHCDPVGFALRGLWTKFLHLLRGGAHPSPKTKKSVIGE